MISLQDPLVVLRNSPCNLRGHNTAVVPRISTYFTKNYIRYRGAVLWNLKDYFNGSCSLKQFYRKAQLISHLEKSNIPAYPQSPLRRRCLILNFKLF